MANDIYNRQVDFGTPLAADSTRLIIPGLSGEDMLVQNFQAQYQQNVNRIWEVGSFKTYFIAGRTQGSMQIKRIIGGSGISTGFIQQYADVCNMNNMAITFDAGCNDTAATGTLNFEKVVITSIAYSVAAADMMINEDFVLLFGKLTSL